MRSLVFLYDGNTPSRQVIGDFAFRLSTECVATNVQAFVGDDKAIAESIIKNVKAEADVAIEEEMTAADKAVVFIGETFRDILSHDYTKMGFILELTRMMFQARKHPGVSKNKALMNALFILSQEDLKISKSLLEQYHLDEEKLLVIKEIYTCAIKR